MAEFHAEVLTFKTTRCVWSERYHPSRSKACPSIVHRDSLNQVCDPAHHACKNVCMYKNTMHTWSCCLQMLVWRYHIKRILFPSRRSCSIRRWVGGGKSRDGGRTLLDARRSSSGLDTGRTETRLLLCEMISLELLRRAFFSSGKVWFPFAEDIYKNKILEVTGIRHNLQVSI